MNPLVKWYDHTSFRASFIHICIPHTTWIVGKGKTFYIKMNNLEEFYELYVEKVYKFFYVQCLDVPTAEDLTSQTFIAFIQKADDAIRDQKKYLYAVMRNVWSEHLRKKYKESVDAISSIDDFSTFAEESVASYEGKSLAERVACYIDRLPEKQRIVAQLRFIEELSVKEVAKEIGKSSLYIKTTQHRAVINLRKMFHDHEIRSAL